MSIASRWQALTGKQKLMWVGGGVALLLVIALASGQGGEGGYAEGPPGYGPQQGQQGYGGPPGYGPQQGQQGYGGPQQANGYYGGPPQGGGYAPPQGGGYAPPQGGYGAPAAGGGGAADNSDPNGYWARQRSQEQQARAFNQTIRETSTVQDNSTGQTYTDVPNSTAYPAVDSGAYSQVPTNELPATSAPSSSE